MTEEIELYVRIRNEWLDSLNAEEYDSLSRAKALDSLSLFCAKHEIKSIKFITSKHKREMEAIFIKLLALESLTKSARAFK